jgi:hypothetical protein
LTERQLPKVVAVAPLLPGAPEDWRTSDTISSVLQLPNSSLFWDLNGVESKQFGAVTSGTVMLFCPNGKRVFAGGITTSRGHEGENDSEDELLAVLLDTSVTAHSVRPVFGCRLFNGELTVVAPDAPLTR